MEENKGWYSRKKLPHFDGGGVTQFITFRLADSLPREVVGAMYDEIQGLKGNIDEAKFERIEYFLAQGAGSCILREPRCAELVQDSLKFLDGNRFDLRHWVIMHNHVHFLARFEEGQSLEKALHSLKSYTAHELKKIHPEMPVIWQQESFDRYIRNESHYEYTVRYIHNNPVVAKICDEPEDFMWSSAARSTGF